MDFGKKGDAKKAMKLHHREGITLKQAWKRVKGKESRKKSSKTSSPKKRKSQSMAKKAMKLHHREGITLKQAWKKVNKFGDTVCPDGYEPNLMWTGKRGQSQCIQVCGSGMSRDRVTNRCKKAPSLVGREIPQGMEINPQTGRLRKVCLPGQYRDPVTKRCRTIKSSRVDSVFPITEPLLIDGKYMASDYRGSRYNPPGLMRMSTKPSRCGCKFGNNLPLSCTAGCH